MSGADDPHDPVTSLGSWEAWVAGISLGDLLLLLITIILLFAHHLVCFVTGALCCGDRQL